MKSTTLKNNSRTNLLTPTISSSVLLLGLLAPSLSHADFGVGLILDNEHKRYKNSHKDDAKAHLGLEYRGEKFNMDQSGISYDFSNSDKYALELFGASKNRGFKAKDSKIFTGMKEREDSVDLGGRAIVTTGIGPIVVEASRDVNSSKGYQAEVKLGGIAPHSSHWNGKREIKLAPAVGVRYQSDDVVDYYYGVKNSEATTNRIAYRGKAATTPYIGLEAQANISEHFSVNAGLGYERRDKTIKNSPLTDNNDNDFTANIGLTYWF